MSALSAAHHALRLTWPAVTSSPHIYRIMTTERMNDRHNGNRILRPQVATSAVLSSRMVENYISHLFIYMQDSIPKTINCLMEGVMYMTYKVSSIPPVSMRPFI